MTPIATAIFLGSFEPGGTERQMIELVRRLDRARWAVHIACFRAQGAWFPRAAEAAASVAEFPIGGFGRRDTLVQAWAFARWCRQQRIAIVHTTELYSNIFALPAAGCAGVPVRIANRREINPDKTVGHIALQRAAYSFAHAVVANSRAAADRLRFERVPTRKVAVIPNGLDVEAWPSGMPPRAPRRVVCVANLRPEKGQDVLIDAAAHVLRRFPDAQFELVGDGPERRRLQTRAEDRGVAGAFTFLGHREDVADRLAASHLFVLPSRSDAFPNGVLEAMAAGLPIVATSVGGIVELIDDRRTGLLTPAGDAVALADRLCTLMADSAFAGRLGRAARGVAESRYSFGRMVNAFESLYLGELTRRRSGVGAPRRTLAES